MDQPHHRSNPALPKRIRLVVEKPKDDYCFYCDDGGDLIVCDTCVRAYCYQEMFDPATQSSVEEEDDADEEIVAQAVKSKCLNVPKGFLEDPNRVFQCPECLATAPDPGERMKYHVHRGGRNTRRMTSRSTIVLIVYYLRSLQKLAEAVLMQISSMLGIFELEVIQHLRKLPQPLKPKGVNELLSIQGPHHLVVILVTESNPLGGWWWADVGDQDGKSQDSEANVLENFTSMLQPVAARAITARIFGIMCGTNLANPSTIKGIRDYMLTVPCWDSLLLPTAESVLPADYITMLPDLFIQLYYYGLGFQSSVLRVWAKSRQVRVQTGLLTIERSRCRTKLELRQFTWAPEVLCPLGVPLPDTPSLCGCWHLNSDWRRIYGHNKFGEMFLYLRSTCCQTELHVAIFLGPRQTMRMHGTTVAVEIWDEDTECFPFDWSRMVVMRTSVKRPKEERDKQKHDGPWTIAGREALINMD